MTIQSMLHITTPVVNVLDKENQAVVKFASHIIQWGSKLQQYHQQLMIYVIPGDSRERPQLGTEHLCCSQ